MKHVIQLTHQDHYGNQVWGRLNCEDIYATISVEFSEDENGVQLDCYHEDPNTGGKLTAPDANMFSVSLGLHTLTELIDALTYQRNRMLEYNGQLHK